MGTVAIQRGHCFRTSGATGGRDEQRFTDEVGRRLAWRLGELGHRVHLLTADQAVPRGLDVFVALHTDGNVNPAKRGASVGYNTDGGRRLAAAWKRAWQRAGFASGFLPDNYTAALRGYYGFGLSDARFEFLAEHGHHSNPAEYDWLHSHYDEAAAAHVAAIGELVGHPRPPGDTVSDPTPTTTAVDAVLVFDQGGGMGVLTVDARGGVYTEGSAVYHGSLPELGLIPNGPVVSIVPRGLDGYYIVGADGGVFAFGNVPAIQPYTPLFDQYRIGARRIVRAFGLGDVLILVSNLGERYTLTG